jgi:hypothetical protein
MPFRERTDFALSCTRDTSRLALIYAGKRWNSVGNSRGSHERRSKRSLEARARARMRGIFPSAKRSEFAYAKGRTLKGRCKRPAIIGIALARHSDGSALRHPLSRPFFLLVFLGWFFLSSQPFRPFPRVLPEGARSFVRRIRSRKFQRLRIKPPPPFSRAAPICCPFNCPLPP